jgi:hypothetical protein
MSVAQNFDESYYLSNNADVVLAISQGAFTSGLQHFQLHGGKSELRDPNATFDSSYYAAQNSDVLSAVSSGAFTSVFAHYQAFGEAENRAPSSTFASFTAAAYLEANADVKAAVDAGTIKSALEHYIAFGQNEVRSGSGVSAAVGSTFTLTTGVDTLTGTANNDTFVADNTGTDVTSTADSLDGGAGTDAINLFSDGAAGALPALTSIETMNLYDQDADFNVSTATSLTTVNLIRSDGAFDLTVGSGVATIGVQDIAVAAADIILTHAAADTAAVVNLNKVTAANAAVSEDVTLVGAGLTNVTINTTGTASSFDGIDVASATSVTVNAGVALTLTEIDTAAASATLTLTGAGAISLGVLDAVFNTVTSTNTGGVTAAIGAEVDTKFTGGAGNDVVTAGTTDALVVANALAVDAGAGTDVLVITETADVDSAADAARYTNFETVRSADSVNVGLLSSVTALQITGGTSETYSGLSAAVGSAITFSANNTTSTIFTLASSGGSSDALTFNLTSGTSTTNVDVVGISAIGVETVNINATTGTDAVLSDFGFLANSADSVSKVTITGSADVQLNVVANTFDVVAATIDASALTGTGHFVLAGTGVLLSGSSVTGSSNADTIALSSTTGTTYAGGAGNDSFNGSVADLVATGTNDSSINGGDGTDTLTVDDATATLTDNHFTNLTNLEALTTSGTSTTSITTGTNFNTAFSSGATITTGTLADTTVYAFNGGLSSVAVNITVSGTDLVGNGAGEDVTVVTGSAADTISVETDATWVGAAADSGTITITSGAGDDTISFGYGTLLAVTTSQTAVITAGTGADTITKTSGDNEATATAVTHFVVGSGDSLATAAGADKITGFGLGTAANFSDGIDFAGTAAIGTLGTSTDFGTILSHSITAGVATFDDAAAFASALVINSSNLTDVVGYLAANTATNDVVAFTYDSTGNGAADATMVYHNGATDSLVQLQATTAVDALITTNATGANDLFIF